MEAHRTSRRPFVRVACALLACACLPIAWAQAPSISDPEVMDKLRNRLYRMLNGEQDKAKVQAPERNVLRLTRKEAPTPQKKPDDKPKARPQPPADPLLPLVRAAVHRADSLPDIPLCPDPAGHAVDDGPPPVRAGDVPAAAAPAPVGRRLTLVPAEAGADPCPPLNAGPPPSPPPVDWAYLGPGAPEHWGRLRVEFAACMIGERQSPVALSEAIPVRLTPLDTQYRPGRFHVIDDGRGLVVSLDGASTLLMDGQRLRLKRIRFHRPGEHVIEGRRPDMSAHLIHENAVGEVVAIAVPMMLGDTPNPALQAVLDNIPLDPGSSQRGLGRLDAADLLPPRHDRYVYEGSLTTPPCTEGVRWLVMREPLGLTALQYEVFEKLFPESARPLQALNGRRIKSTM